MPIIETEFMDLTAGLDVQAFWAENERCRTLTTGKPRCALSYSPDDHWIFEFMQVPSTLRYYQDKAYRDALHAEVNAITRQYVGRAFFDEDTLQTAPKRIENLFGAEFAYYEGGTPWFVPVTDDPREFERVLDRAEATNMSAWAFPDEFLEEWYAATGGGSGSPRAWHRQSWSSHHHDLGVETRDSLLLALRPPGAYAPFSGPARR